MSWVEKNKKNNNWGGDDYLGVESNYLIMKIYILNMTQLYNHLLYANWIASMKRHTKFFEMLAIMVETPSFSNQIEIPGILIEIQGFESNIELHVSKY